MRRNLIAIFTVTLALAGCAGDQKIAIQPPITVTSQATPAAPTPADPLSVLSSFTVADLQAASLDAHANNDPAHSWTCWDYLAAQVAALPPIGAAKNVGAFLAFQKARDLVNGAASASGALSGLNLACSAVVIDTQTTLNKLALLGAGTAATGGALGPALGGLPAIGAALPIPLP